MTMLRVGDVQILRVEESHGPGFRAPMLLPAFNLDAVDNHGPDVFGHFMQLDTQAALLSVHTWVLRTPRSLILVDTCTGNHKERPSLPGMHMLQTPYLERLAAAGVAPEDVDFVVSTHLHVDHVGFNTTLRDGRWVPTFPNATYLMNRTEFDFWNPTNPANADFAFNAGVFADSVAPCFEADQVRLWSGTYELDEVFHLFETPGHTPGNAAGWLHSKDRWALFSGDNMHSPMQVFEPSWSSAFDFDGRQAERTRRSILETCAERDAHLLAAHFPAPHVFKVVQRGNGLAAVAALSA
jgi:glyoxylase-like metal-dependent hydrolase (beta-lactamase superfamily II)